MRKYDPIRRISTRRAFARLRRQRLVGTHEAPCRSRFQSSDVRTLGECVRTGLVWPNSADERAAIGNPYGTVYSIIEPFCSRHSDFFYRAGRRGPITRLQPRLWDANSRLGNCRTIGSPAGRSLPRTTSPKPSGTPCHRQDSPDSVIRDRAFADRLRIEPAQ